MCYRPLPFDMAVLTYSVFGSNPFAFHSLNIVLKLLGSICFFLFLRRFFIQTKVHDGSLIAWFSSCSFACYPLHVEVVDWCIGIFDLLCFLFFSLSLYFFLLGSTTKGRKRSVSILVSLPSFGAALLCKEHAAILPLLLSIISAISAGSASRGSWLRDTMKATYPFWGLLFAYFIIRFAVLGTFLGGYYGIAHFIVRPLDDSNLWDKFLVPVIFPFNREILESNDWRVRILAAVYWVVLCRACLFPLDLKQVKKQLKALCFFAIWFLLALLVVSGVFCINGDLSGSRHFFSASAPALVLLFMIIWLPISPNVGISATRLTILVSMVVSLGVIGSFWLLTLANSSAFVAAGQNIARLQKQLIQLLERLEPKEKVVLINPPQKQQGVHLIYHREMLDAMLGPPFTDTTLADRLIIPSKFMFLNQDMLSISRLRNLNRCGVPMYLWDAQYGLLRSLKLLPNEGGEFHSKLVPFRTYAQGDWTVREYKISSEELRKTDLIRFRACCAPHPKGSPGAEIPKVVLGWVSDRSHQMAIAPKEDGVTHSYDFPVSGTKSWLCFPPRGLVTISSYNSRGQKCIFDDFALFSDSTVVPVLNHDFSECDNLSGVINITDQSKSISFDSSKVKNAKFTILEISKPNMLFEAKANSLRKAEGFDFIGRKIRFPLNGRALISGLDLIPGYTYELRLRAIDERGKPLGYYSDPVFLELK